MRHAPLFETLAADPAATAVFGSPPRVFIFGDAGDGPVAKPYVVWQTVTGSPENYLGDRPDVDQFSLQVDVYASTAAQARAGAEVVMDAIETSAYVTAYNGESREAESRDFRYSFSVDWYTHR